MPTQNVFACSGEGSATLNAGVPVKVLYTQSAITSTLPPRVKRSSVSVPINVRYAGVYGLSDLTPNRGVFWYKAIAWILENSEPKLTTFSDAVFWKLSPGIVCDLAITW